MIKKIDKQKYLENNVLLILKGEYRQGDKSQQI